MSIFKKVYHQLETNIKFVALLSIIIQLIAFTLLLTLGINSNFVEFFIIFCIFFYPINIIIGLSRYLEIKSKTKKEVLLNFFYFINTFPFLTILITSFLYLITINFKPKEENINPGDIKFIIVDDKGNEIEKNSEDVNFNFETNKFNDSIIRVEIEE